MSSLRRIVAVARALSWWRVRRQTLVWLTGSWIAVLATMCAVAPPEVPWIVRVAFGTLGVVAFGQLPAADASGWPDEVAASHPVRSGERRVALLLSDAWTTTSGLVLTSLGCAGLLLGSLWILMQVLAASRDPAVPVAHASSFGTAAAHVLLGLGTAAIVIGPHLVAGLFVASAPVVLGRWRTSGLTRGGGLDRVVLVQAAIVALWATTRQPASAVLASLVWIGVPAPAAPAADLENDDVVPRIGPEGRGRVRRSKLPLIAGTLVVTEIGIRLAPRVLGIWSADAAHAFVDHPEAAAFARALLAFAAFGTLQRSDVPWRPAEDSAGFSRNLPADDVLRFQRHLPIAPKTLLDATWVDLALASVGGGALATAWLAATGGLPVRGPGAVFAASAAIAVGPALFTWLRAGRLARRADAAPMSGAMMATVFGAMPCGLVVAPRPFDGLAPIGFAWVVGLVLLATATWAWARRRWTT